MQPIRTRLQLVPNSRARGSRRTWRQAPDRSRRAKLPLHCPGKLVRTANDRWTPVCALATRRDRSTSPAVPSTNCTASRNPGSAHDTRHGAFTTIPEEEFSSGIVLSRIAASSLSIHSGAMSPIPAPEYPNKGDAFECDFPWALTAEIGSKSTRTNPSAVQTTDNPAGVDRPILIRIAE